MSHLKKEFNNENFEQINITNIQRVETFFKNDLFKGYILHLNIMTERLFIDIESYFIQTEMTTITNNKLKEYQEAFVSSIDEIALCNTFISTHSKKFDKCTLNNLIDQKSDPEFLIKFNKNVTFKSAMIKSFKFNILWIDSNGLFWKN